MSLWSTIFFVICCITAVDSCMRQPAKVKVTCPADKNQIADRKSSTALVRWTRDEFQIDSTHPIRGVYQTIPVYGASGDVGREFGEGSHYVEYKAVDEGGRFDSCSFTVTINVIKCPRLHNPDYGLMSCDADNVYGSECSVSCFSGYSVKGLSDVHCLQNGSWSASLPACIAQTCADPGTPIHGHRYCTSITHSYGSICSFTCDHRHHLIGASRIICEATENGTRWTDNTPTCEEITPPRAEACPQDIKESTGSFETEVHKPEIRFVTSEGHPAPYACTHFGNRDSFNFTIGVHTVKCTAFDPNYGNDATASCTFQVIIKPNPCRPLSQPLNGKLICSRSEGGTSPPLDTTCKLHCNEGFMLPRQDDGMVADTFCCDHVGNWKPHHYVPSCVRPKRSQELKLPCELFYTSSNCSNTDHLEEVDIAFQIAVQTTVRRESNCARTPGDCIVDNVDSSCQYSAFDPPRALPFRHSRKRARSVYHIVGQSRAKPASQSQPKVERYLESGSDFVVTIQFDFGTRIPEVGGLWPEEHHKAVKRLYGMYDFFERQVKSGNFQLGSEIKGMILNEVRNSLTLSHEKVLCDIGYVYDSNTLYCVPCGPGSSYNYTGDRCELCRVGTYQREEAKLSCRKCHPGTTTLDRGAVTASQCIDVDECESSPCENEGVCQDGLNSYTCLCNPGYGGVNCEVRVYNCSEHACLNGGTCVPDGGDNYTCLCRPAYSGQYCQYHSIHGSWSSWSAWSACSQSCEGGTQQRVRQCDSPPPTNGGRPCPGASVEKRVCNDIVCPECKLLRRPYGGTIHCEDVSKDLKNCTIACKPGYAFSAPVLPAYTCGKNTSYLWPHESPDNPRCILPACTKIEEPVAETYTFEASVSTSSCSTELQSELTSEVQRSAEQYTSNLECLRDGSCHLDLPEVGECREALPGRRRRGAAGGGGGGEGGDPASDLRFRISLVYDGKDRKRKHAEAESGSLELSKVTSELSQLKSRVIRELQDGTFHLNTHTAKVRLRAESVVATATPQCEEGTEPAADGDFCVACAPGSFYSGQTRSCVLCSEGSYQPHPKQLQCLTCPQQQITYGRGALWPLECYPKGEVPPTIPANVSDIPEEVPLAPGPHGTLVIAVCVPLIGLMLVLILLLLFYRNRKKKRSYRTKQKRRRGEREDLEENISLTQKSPTKC